MIVVVWRFLYCDEILKVMREDMMNDTFMKEKPDFAAADIYGITDGSVHAGKFTL